MVNYISKRQYVSSACALPLDMEYNMIKTVLADSGMLQSLQSKSLQEVTSGTQHSTMDLLMNRLLVLDYLLRPHQFFTLSDLATLRGGQVSEDVARRAIAGENQVAVLEGDLNEQLSVHQTAKSLSTLGTPNWIESLDMRDFFREGQEGANKLNMFVGENVKKYMGSAAYKRPSWSKCEGFEAYKHVDKSIFRGHSDAYPSVLGLHGVFVYELLSGTLQLNLVPNSDTDETVLPSLLFHLMGEHHALERQNPAFVLNACLLACADTQLLAEQLPKLTDFVQDPEKSKSGGFGAFFGKSSSKNQQDGVVPAAPQ